MPDDLKIVQPDPSLPKELSAFHGKWEGNDGYGGEYFFIIEKIDKDKASLYNHRSRAGSGEAGFTRAAGWQRFEGVVSKWGKKYKVTYMGVVGPVDLTFKGEDLNMSFPQGSFRLKRVP